MDPKRVSIKTMKTVESIDQRLARIEAALGLGPHAPAPADDDADDPVGPTSEAKAVDRAAAVTTKGKARG